MNMNDYKDVFVFAEQRGGNIEPVAYELLGEGRRLADALGKHLVAMLVGYRMTDSMVESLIQAGADKVIRADAPELEYYLTEQYSQTVYQIIVEQKPEIVLFGATTIGRDLAPRLSARLGTGLTADCTKLEISPEGELMMTRPAFGGNLMATIRCSEHRPQMSTVRPGVMRRNACDASRSGQMIDFTPAFDRSKFRVKMVEKVEQERCGCDICQAKILVSGGRGVGTGNGFDKLRALAAVIGGEVSSSRAMVDAGVMPHERQVGQTGKTVRPTLYMACGISGAIQHLAGMEESDYIVAINKDRYAPIFSVADLGIVADLHKVIPLLTERLAKEAKH